MTYAAQQIAAKMTAAEILREIAARNISIVPAFDGRIWTASVDEKGVTFASKKRKVRMISATASTPIAAVSGLIAMLDAESQLRKEAACT